MYIVIERKSGFRLGRLTSHTILNRLYLRHRTRSGLERDLIRNLFELLIEPIDIIELAYSHLLAETILLIGIFNLLPQVSQQSFENIDFLLWHLCSLLEASLAKFIDFVSDELLLLDQVSNQAAIDFLFDKSLVLAKILVANHFGKAIRRVIINLRHL